MHARNWCAKSLDWGLGKGCFSHGFEIGGLAILFLDRDIGRRVRVPAFLCLLVLLRGHAIGQQDIDVAALIPEIEVIKPVSSINITLGLDLELETSGQV